MYPFGAIVLVRFPFTDLSGTKMRPALVVSRDNDRRTDLILSFITSVPRSGPDIVPLAALPETELKTPSVVRFDKLVTLDPSLIAGPMGAAPKDWLIAQTLTFFRVFGFELPEAARAPYGQNETITGRILDTR